MEIKRQIHSASKSMNDDDGAMVLCGSDDEGGQSKSQERGAKRERGRVGEGNDYL